MVTEDNIKQAAERLRGVAHRTPLTRSETFSRQAGCDVMLKHENRQKTGSFKIRGAYVKLSSLEPERLAAGVVAASAGNHGQAVAWAARELGAPARIFMPQDSPMAKVDATRNYGAEVGEELRNQDPNTLDRESLAEGYNTLLEAARRARLKR